ncbi:hypothetical protein JCM33374_g6666 [Metschnikowia sp. JCM 33374]|nr:hypothetical protein JCM33374_g6666 [Metschnikowia sp. JCM 33374]
MLRCSINKNGNISPICEPSWVLWAMQFQYVPVLRDELRGEQRWFLFWTVVSANVTGLLYHGLFGSYKESRASDHQLHGGMTLQFIGERLPYNRMELLLLDCGIFILQLLYFCLMCTTEDSEVVQGQASSFASIEDTISSDIVSDGFDGNVNLLTIDVWASIQASWRHERSPVSPEDFAALTSFRERALRRMAV